MTHKMYGALIASLGAVALMLAADPALARPGAAARGGSASTHSVSHRSVAFRSLRHQSFRNHRRDRDNVGGFWPGEGFFNEPSSGEPIAGATQPTSGDIHYTNTYDVPWDWAHRYPPAVAPSDRPYVPGCHAETVTVPGRDGEEQTINVMRCY
jgi:hypothetical protein